MNRSKRYTKDLLKELKDDIVYYLDSPLTIQVGFSGEIIITPHMPNDILHLFYALKLAYLEQTNEFKLLHLLLQKQTLSIEAITNYLFVSPSYVRKIINRMNTFLQPFQFQIVDEKKNYELKGNELSIRLFFYVIMNDTYQSIPWPYKSKHFPDSIDYRQSLHIMLTILNSRKSHKNHMPVLSKKSAWIIAHMKETYNFIPHLKSQNTYFHNSLNQAIIEEYFIFFSHICTPQVVPKEVKLALGEKFLNTSTDIIFSKVLSYRIIDYFQLDYEDEKKYLLAYYLTVLEGFYDLMQETTILFEKLVFPPLEYSLLFEKTYVKEIMQVFQNFLSEEHHRELLNNYKLQQYFCSLIYTILQIETPPVVRVFLYIINDITAQDLIQTRLEMIYNSNTVLFVPYFEQADLVVTDSLNFDQDIETEIFSFNTILKEDQWSLLLQKINQLILTKMTTQERNCK
ncbi:helix-turn-helix domain-containing protein [Enterococcus faecalis]|uniref:helix-turn-helix domain-containing protein n=1 Tax=Enterococcus faecalis TaxID=1351 RepID=UPI00232EB3C0|nr:helix-turn-helix domain-containing protein [Enterococcus faecalis]MDB1624915.1 helix-turn-helix domain-containing protein [Enterococcus faecalis]